MRPAHTCRSCGRQLASLRSSPAPATGGRIIECPDCGAGNPWHKPPSTLPRRLFAGGSAGSDIFAFLTLAATLGSAWLFFAGIGSLAIEPDWASIAREGPLRAAANLTGVVVYSGIVGLFLAIAFAHWNGFAVLAASLAAAFLAVTWEELTKPAGAALAHIVTLQGTDGLQRLPALPRRWELPTTVASAMVLLAYAFRSLVLTAVRLRVARLRRTRLLIRKRQPWRLRHAS